MMGGIIACLLMFPPLIVGIILGSCFQREKDEMAMLRSEAKGRREGWNEHDRICHPEAYGAVMVVYDAKMKPLDNGVPVA